MTAMLIVVLFTHLLAEILCVLKEMMQVSSNCVGLHTGVLWDFTGVFLCVSCLHIVGKCTKIVTNENLIIFPIFSLRYSQVHGGFFSAFSML